MKRGTRLKLEFIRNESLRKQTFNKRKRGLLKKLNELVTLCDIKACAVIFSPYQSSPESWPSKEGVDEVVSRFMALSERDRTKKMFDQQSYLLDRITKGKEQVKKVYDRNREHQLRECMYDCLKGKIMEYNYDDARDIRDLGRFIDHYLIQLTHRIDVLKENGESSPSLPLPHPPIVADPSLPVVEDATYDIVSTSFHDHIQYQNMNIKQEDLVQYQDFVSFTDQPCHILHDMELNQNMHVDSNQKGIPRTVSYVEDRGDIPFTEDMHQHYHQSPTTNLALAADATTSLMPSNTTSNGNGFAPYITNVFSTIVSHMPSTTTANGLPTITTHMPSTTTSAANLFVPKITNDLATTDHMSSITTSNASGFAPYITNGLSTITAHIPSTTASNANAFVPNTIDDIATTGNMSSTTTSTADAFAPYITNDFSTIASHMPPTSDVNGFSPYITNGISTITTHMPSITASNANGLAPYNDISTPAYMPSIITSNANHFAPYITNGISTTDSITTANANGFVPYITNGISTINNHMSSTTTANDNGLDPYFINGLWGQSGYFE